ncbi:hypothetical protein HID58_078706, partial [Brassica napus]
SQWKNITNTKAFSTSQNKKKMTVSFHARSNSVPSLQHPQAAYVDEQLTRLRSSEAVSSSSSSSIYQRLSNLQDLYDSLEKMIRLSITNQALSQDQIEKLIDGSLMILDLCNAAKDALSQMKEGLKEIQSILRRKRGDLSAEVKKYLATRKSLKKSFQKVLKNLKVGQNKETTGRSLVVFGQTEGVTVALFESLFSFMSGSKACGKWSLVSKIMSQNKATCEAEANEFTRVDYVFQSEKLLKMEDVQMLESCIQDLEDGIESLSNYPSRQHPQAAHIDEQLTRLRSSEATSSSSICQRLNNLQDLHDSLEKMIRLCITNQALSQEQIEKLLEGSLKILDLCNISKDVKNLKVGQNKESQESLAVFGEAEAVTVALFQSLFSFMSGSKACAKWSMVSKLMNQNKINLEANEFTLVDLEFQSEKSLKIEDVQILESCIQDLEDGLESLSKSLIKYRVSILNIL